LTLQYRFGTIAKVGKVSKRGDAPLFVNFFYELKKAGVPVSLTEWMTLMEALSIGLAYSSLNSFYYLARAILVKSEAYFDNFDQAFYNYFKDVETSDDLVEQALKLMENKKVVQLMFEDEEEESPADRKGKRPMVPAKPKVGGKKLYLASPGGPKGGKAGGARVGQGGYNPQGGIRLGGAPSGGSAVKVAGERLYRGYRSDAIIGVRRFEAALRVLRQLTNRNEELKDELDLDATIEATSRNAGRLEIVWDRPRKNKLKVLLVMDSGGSMDSYISICSQLFTAVKRSTHFKELKYYYFHNCIYENIYKKPACIEANAMKTADFLREHDSEYLLIIVGDASMAPPELTQFGGAIDYDVNDNEPGLIWLERVIKHFKRAVWLNPISAKAWDETKNYRAQSISMIRSIIPMFELSLDGLNQAVKKLKVRA
jgi:uncharacterized protein with von Willebrand factor type A (vWA) domain